MLVSCDFSTAIVIVRQYKSVQTDYLNIITLLTNLNFMSKDVKHDFGRQCQYKRQCVSIRRVNICVNVIVCVNRSVNVSVYEQTLSTFKKCLQHTTQ